MLNMFYVKDGRNFHDEIQALLPYKKKKKGGTDVETPN